MIRKSTFKEKIRRKHAQKTKISIKIKLDLSVFVHI